MDKFYIITNPQKDIDFMVRDAIKEFLEGHGKECAFSCPERRQGEKKFRYTDPDAIPEDTECVLVLGGDGTLIQAARDLFGKDIPFVGVNFGTLGYLAEIEKQTIIPALKQLMEDHYTVENRMMLDGYIMRDGQKIEEDVALNDIVISRHGALRVIKYKVYVNGEYLNQFAADGIIISTPTGSTAYNLSAGGPIVSPKASLLVMTPICPHTLNTRSIILSAEDVITIELCRSRSDSREENLVSFDGDNSKRVKSKDQIVISCSRHYTRIIKLNQISFLEVLGNKMSSNE